jgi:hypothetical protein
MHGMVTKYMPCIKTASSKLIKKFWGVYCTKKDSVFFIIFIGSPYGATTFFMFPNNGI